MTICNREALAVVRMPTEAEEQLRAIHRQHEQLVKARKQLEAQGRSLMVNHGVEPIRNGESAVLLPIRNTPGSNESALVTQFKKRGVLTNIAARYLGWG